VTPKRLVDLPPVELTETDRRFRVARKRQTITIYPDRPMWLMSPGLRVYRKADVFSFVGWISRIEFEDGSAIQHAERPTATVTIVPRES
jgi:hypothetical protein